LDHLIGGVLDRKVDRDGVPNLLRFGTRIASSQIGCTKLSRLVLVLDEGRIVARGKAAPLLASSALFRSIWGEEG